MGDSICYMCKQDKATTAKKMCEGCHMRCVATNYNPMLSSYIGVSDGVGIIYHTEFDPATDYPVWIMKKAPITHDMYSYPCYKGRK